MQLDQIGEITPEALWQIDQENIQI